MRYADSRAPIEQPWNAPGAAALTVKHTVRSKPSRRFHGRSCMLNPDTGADDRLQYVPGTAIGAILRHLAPVPASSYIASTMTRAARCLTLVFLLLSPGLGGLWLTAGHPCAVAELATPLSHDPHSHHVDPSRTPASHPCDCIAHCTLSAVNVTSAAPALRLVVQQLPGDLPAPPRLGIRVTHPQDLLPLATAPPHLR